MELSDLWSGCKPWTFKTVACQTWELPWWFSCLPVTLSPQGNPVQFAAAFVVAFLITNSVRSLTRLDMVKREVGDCVADVVLLIMVLVSGKLALRGSSFPSAVHWRFWLYWFTNIVFFVFIPAFLMPFP
eukprot:GHVQ01018543.1.p1 GENE.GHVQ01018543.1~~GHVQ01018543.1.p1  ORF type:complete len:129 (+),score=9.18 GHVQ01018543.1:101-487(+)